MNCNSFLKIYERNLSIIDIRDSEDYDESHIPGSINVSHIDLVLDPSAYLEEGVINYIICDEGITSANVIKMIKGNYLLINIIDGYVNWRGPVIEKV